MRKCHKIYINIRKSNAAAQNYTLELKKYFFCVRLNWQKLFLCLIRCQPRDKCSLTRERERLATIEGKSTKITEPERLSRTPICQYPRTSHECLYHIRFSHCPHSCDPHYSIATRYKACLNLKADPRLFNVTRVTWGNTNYRDSCPLSVIVLRSYVLLCVLVLVPQLFIQAVSLSN